MFCYYVSTLLFIPHQSGGEGLTVNFLSQPHSHSALFLLILTLLLCFPLCCKVLALTHLPLCSPSLPGSSCLSQFPISELILIPIFFSKTCKLIPLVKSFLFEIPNMGSIFLIVGYPKQTWVCI